MPREDRATWKSNYFMKIIVSLSHKIVVVHTQCDYSIVFLSVGMCNFSLLWFVGWLTVLSTCSNFWMTFQNASLLEQTMWGPSRCRPSVCHCVARLWCWWVKTPWCAKPSVATWRTILPLRSEFFVFCVFLFAGLLQCSLCSAVLSFPLHKITCFQLSLSVQLPGNQGRTVSNTW